MQKSKQGLLITVFPRLHLTLIGMNIGGYRINGGIGFAIENPTLNITVKMSKKLGFIDTRNSRLNLSEIEKILITLENVRNKLKFQNCIDIEVSGDMPTHYGFGSSTAIRLSCLESLFIFNECKFENDLLVELSGRGRTSGIGINTYFSGGFIFDIGRVGDCLQSSSFSEYFQKSVLLLDHQRMPLWAIGICVPSEVDSKSEEEEKKFFENTCPISDNQVYETLYHSLFGVFASIRENDFNTFCKALNNIQKCAWKDMERKQYGDDLFELEENLYQCGASAVGMSSLGPSLLFLADDVNSVIEEMHLRKLPCNLIKTRPINRGRVIRYA